VTRWTVSEALRELSAIDPVMADLIERHEPMPSGRVVPSARRFEVLARAIAHQQLSGRAAATIWERVRISVGGAVDPEVVLRAGPEALRACGLSAAKVASMLDLSLATVEGRLDLASLGRRSDDEVVSHLVQIRGVGRWTAEMFLMSALRRPDVWPTGDLGVRVGYGRAWLDGRTPSTVELAEFGDRFRPWRSVVAWYCWRATEEPVQRSTATPSGK